MLNRVLANLYEIDLRKLIEEVKSFRNEEDLWRIQGAVNNSCGNLVLHIIGGLNYLIGATLAGTGYVRDRDQEFIRKDVERKVLVSQLEALISLINETLNALTVEQMEADTQCFSTSLKLLLPTYWCNCCFI
jgi:hypothetical protein